MIIHFEMNNLSIFRNHFYSGSGYTVNLNIPYANENNRHIGYFMRSFIPAFNAKIDRILIRRKTNNSLILELILS